MANPFFKPAAAKAAPSAAPGMTGQMRRIAAAVQQAGQVYRGLGDPSAAIDSALQLPLFAGYTGARDAQSVLRYGCGQLGLDADTFLGTIKHFVE